MTYNKEKANLRKRVAVAQFGGVCECCGMSFIAMRQAHFHHIDSTTKKHNMAEMWNSYSDKTIQEELSKCMLLCSNCHDALHEIMGESVTTEATRLFVATYGVNAE